MHFKWHKNTYNQQSDKPSSGKSLLLLIILGTVIGMFGLASNPFKNATNQVDTEPLIMVMQGLMNDMEQINKGIWYEQYGIIDTAATNIAHHPKALVKERKAIAKTLGDKISQFAHYDKVVHHHADSIALAAQQKDMQEILRHYRIVHSGCVDCHADFRSTLRDTLQALRVEQ